MEESAEVPKKPTVEEQIVEGLALNRFESYCPKDLEMLRLPSAEARKEVVAALAQAVTFGVHDLQIPTPELHLRHPWTKKPNPFFDYGNKMVMVPKPDGKYEIQVLPAFFLETAGLGTPSKKALWQIKADILHELRHIWQHGNDYKTFQTETAKTHLGNIAHDNRWMLSTCELDAEDYAKGALKRMPVGGITDLIARGEVVIELEKSIVKMKEVQRTGDISLSERAPQRPRKSLSPPPPPPRRISTPPPPPPQK